MEQQERPIFIVGVHRSGTTLLRYMLSSNPRIYIPPESDFIPYFFSHDPMGKLNERRIAHLLTVIFNRYRFVREWKGNPPDPVEMLANLPSPTPAAFLNALYGAYAAQNGAVRWGDKTPIYSSYMDLIHEILPQAQFIHIMRDGRDVAVSMLDQWGEKDFHIDQYFAARNWVRRTRQARRSGKRLGPNKYYELKYEDLVNNPDRELQPICAFLGETYFPIMATPHHLGQQRIEDGSFHAPIREPPSTKRIARWREEMDIADLRLFQHIAGSLLKDLAYPLADVGKMPTKERLRLYKFATKYVILQSGRRVLQSFGIFPPI